MNSSLDFAVEALRPLLAELGLFLPKLMLAVLIVLGGWLLAKALRFTVIKALRSINFHVLTERAGVDAFLKMCGQQIDTTALIGLLAHWLLVIVALILAFNTLGLGYTSELLTRLALFVPRLILALVILVVGSYFARVVDDMVTTYGSRAGFADTRLAAALARYAVLLFVILAAFDQLEIGGDIIRQSFLIILAGVVFALALAFGLGGRRWAAGLIEQWWRPRQVENSWRKNE
ncbi:MAG: mechanosensitive ion channel family protein [Bacteroidota bacterium]